MNNHKATIRAVNAAFENGSVEEVLSLCTPDINWTMVGMGTWSGADTIRANWASMMGDSKPPKIAEDRILVDGDAGMCDGIVTTQRKDGSTMTVYYCDTYRFDADGKITEMKSYCIDEKAAAAHAAETALTAAAN